MTLAACSEGGGLNPMSFTDQHGNVVLERMRYQRETGHFCDVYINVKNRQFAAHRNIIAACSPYFDSILKATKITKEQVTVNCSNPHAFELFLNYMYSGSVVIDRSCVTDLLKLANNFLVTKLKNYCAEYLDRYLDAANCLSVRHLATKYNIPSLLKASCEFFDININRCLVESVDILQYSLSQIQKLLEEPKYYNVISPDVHLKLIIRWISEDVEHREIYFKQLLAAAPTAECSESALDFLLDYAPLLQKSLPSRLLLLHTMVENEQMMPKYEEQYNNLAAQMEGIIENFSLPTSHVPVNEEGDYSDYDQEDNISMYPSDGESTIEPPVDGHPSTDDVLEEGTYVSEAVGTRLRLKISLGGGGGGNSSGSDTNSHQRKYKERQKAYRKSISSAKGLKRRGRPPKRITDEDVDMAAFDEDELDGVYADASHLENTVTYTDEDVLDPFEVEEGEEVSDPTGSNPCTYCRFASNSEEETNRHIARKHNRNTIFICPQCTFECNWSHDFYEHVVQHYQGIPFNCDQCAFVSDDRIQDLLAHQLIHSDIRLFKCAQCGFRGRTRTQIWAHEKMHTDEGILHCMECGRSFNQKCALEFHMETHADPRPHVCEECGFSSKSADHLLTHRKGHNGDIFFCHIEGCDYSSPKKSQLAAHLRTHMAVRAHTCRICGRGFIEKSHLVRHERIHLKDKPFKCDACDYASSRRDKLKEHILKHHNGNSSSKAHRRRYKRARQLAALAAQARAEMALTGQETTFRPIDPSEQIEQWQTQSYGHSYGSPLARASSVSCVPGPSHPHALSPTSMSMMNVNLAGPDTPLLQGDKDLMMDANMGSSLTTPVPRSPHNHSETYGCNTPDLQSELMNRPMSLPPYATQAQQQNNQRQQQMLQMQQQQQQQQHEWW